MNYSPTLPRNLLRMDSWLITDDHIQVIKLQSSELADNFSLTVEEYLSSIFKFYIWKFQLEIKF